MTRFHQLQTPINSVGQLLGCLRIGGVQRSLELVGAKPNALMELISVLFEASHHCVTSCEKCRLNGERRRSHATPITRPQSHWKTKKESEPIALTLFTSTCPRQELNLHAISGTSALSGLDFGVESFEFDAGVFELEVPVNAALFGVGFF